MMQQLLILANPLSNSSAAIDVGKKGDAKGGNTHAREALKHLEMASQPKK